MNEDANRVLTVAIALVFVAGYFAVDYYDKKVNYAPVQARISKVEELCYMEKKVGRSTTTSDTLACDLAHNAVKSHPKWQGFIVKRTINVAYEYVSPVDNRTHAGSRMMSAWPDGKKLSSGQVFEIRASKKDAEKTREI